MPDEEFEFNGLNWRTLRQIRKEYTSPMEFTGQQSRRFYYTPSWQLIEERLDEGDAAGDDRYAQQFWGIRYIDDAIHRCVATKASYDAGCHRLERSDSRCRVPPLGAEPGATACRFGLRCAQLAYQLGRPVWNGVESRGEIRSPGVPAVPDEEFEYNGLNWRTLRQIRREYTSPMPFTGQQSRWFYYTPSWQLIEERLDDGNAAGDDRYAQQFWGIRYIDDAIHRRVATKASYDAGCHRLERSDSRCLCGAQSRSAVDRTASRSGIRWHLATHEVIMEVPVVQRRAMCIAHGLAVVPASIWLWAFTMGSGQFGEPINDRAQMTHLAGWCALLITSATVAICGRAHANRRGYRVGWYLMAAITIHVVASVALAIVMVIVFARL